MYYFLTKNLIDDFFQNSFESNDYPKFRFKNKGEFFEIVGILPGFGKEDLSIDIQGDTLTISGSIEEHEGLNICDKFKKVFNLDSYRMDLNKIESNYKNGILKVLIYKKEENRLSNKITIS
jgi:HSP20 family protein